jgi:hypothetical protein
LALYIARISAFNTFQCVPNFLTLQSNLSRPSQDPGRTQGAAEANGFSDHQRKDPRALVPAKMKKRFSRSHEDTPASRVIFGYFRQAFFAATDIGLSGMMGFDVRIPPTLPT